ncbi:hypothetical protein SBADM41S_00161 [Streptomyces badius]
MKARESQLASSSSQAQLDRIFPVCTPDASDSASFDEVLELLDLGGRSLPHAVLMMVPEAWENHDSMDGSPGRVTRRPASVSSRRRRTTTSTPSKTSRS